MRVILVDEYFFLPDSRRKRGRKKSQGQKYCRTITCLNLNLFGTVCALLLLYLWQNKYQCVILLCVTIVPWQQRIFMTQDNFQFVSFFSCFDKKLVVEQPKLYGQRGENVLKVGTYAQKSKYN